MNDGEQEKTVPYERFAAKVGEVKEIRAQLDALTAEHAAAKAQAEQAATHQAAAQEWQAKHAALEGQFGRYRDLTANGITDPDVAEVAEWTYSRLPEKDRPAFGDALKAWKAKPEEAPTALRPFLTSPGQGGGNGAGGVNRGAAGGGAAGPPALGADAITRMSPEEYRKNRDLVIASYRNGH